MKYIPYIIVLILALWMGWRLRGCQAPVPAGSEPRIVYRDREITRRDTVTVDWPTTRIIYQKQADTVRISVPVPVSAVNGRRDTTRFTGLITPTPIRTQPGRVILTYWSPDSLRYVQDMYRVPERRWGYSVTASGLYDVDRPSVHLLVNMRYRNVSAFGGVVAAGDRSGVQAGVRVRLWGRD